MRDYNLKKEATLMTIDILIDELNAVSRRIYCQSQLPDIDNEKLLSLCSLLESMTKDLNLKVAELVEINNCRYII